ncbi:MAG: hypothetical protein ACWGQW_11130 [bacterium]
MTEESASTTNQEDDFISSPEEVPGYLSPEKIERILEEIATYEVDLAPDPTLPELGLAYIQKVISICRQYLNRVQYYLQIAKRYEKNLRRARQIYELDLEMKMADLLADDPIVRQQKAVPDRRALALTRLREEHRMLGRFRVEMQEIDDAIKIIKSTYSNLRNTNSDIRLQRQLVKDDKDDQMGGDKGYNAPTANQDRTYDMGMPPAVRSADIDPTEIRVGVQNEENMAKEIKNEALRDFLKKTSPEEPAKPIESVKYQDLLKE